MGSESKPETKGGASRVVALIGMMAAIYYVLLWLPGIPCIGIPQIKMQVGASFAPVMGLLLGPFMGAAAAFVGDVLKTLVPPQVYGLPFIFSPVVSALSAGYVVRRKWKIPFALLLGILVASMFTPVFYPLTEQWKVYILAFFDKIVALALIPVTVSLLKRRGKARFHLLLFLAMFIGIATDKALGCLVFSLPPVYKGLFGVPSAEVARGLFMVSPFIYPVEYVLEALLAYVIALPLLKIMTKVGFLREFLKLEELSKLV